LVYLPNSRHARMQALEPAAPPAVEPRRRLRLVDCAPAGPWRSDLADDARPESDVRRLESRIEQLSRALSRALRVGQTTVPGAAAPGANPDEPYGRYRWLARRRRRWWHLS
ncbi:MAG TPA: hypothetical protein VEZ14_10315, partial [Dehalococcoidia bacterium]|nr:hypothetical protein [Dehalococcoidia bacterium]